MDEADFERGLGDLNLLAQAEYHQDIGLVASDSDGCRAATRMGRPARRRHAERAIPVEYEQTGPSPRSAAYRSRMLKDEPEFASDELTGLWQYTALTAVKDVIGKEDKYVQE